MLFSGEQNPAVATLVDRPWFFSGNYFNNLSNLARVSCWFASVGCKFCQDNDKEQTGWYGISIVFCQLFSILFNSHVKLFICVQYFLINILIKTQNCRYLLQISRPISSFSGGRWEDRTYTYIPTTKFEYINIHWYNWFYRPKITLS